MKAPSDCYESHTEEVLARRVGRLGMYPGRRGYRGGGDVINVGICTGAVENNCGIYSDMPNL